MKEPNGTCDGDEKPYSRMPIDWLQEAVAVMPGNRKGDMCDGLSLDYQIDFRRRYAAILLRERGF